MAWEQGELGMKLSFFTHVLILGLLLHYQCCITEQIPKIYTCCLGGGGAGECGNVRGGRSRMKEAHGKGRERREWSAEDSVMRQNRGK